MSDRSDRIDLRGWTAPPVPADLADRVMTAIDARPIEVAADVPGPIASAREPITRRSPWPRYLAVAAGSAAIAAASTWWLAARAHPPRTVDVAIMQTAGTVEVASGRGARLRITTPLGVIEAGPEPTRLTVSPMNPDDVEHEMKRKALAIGGGAALLAGGIAIAVHQGTARVSNEGAPTAIVTDGQSATIEPGPAASAHDGPRQVAHATRDRALREQLATAIAAARQRRAARPPAAVGTGLDAAPLAVGRDTDEAARLPLSKEDIRTGVREMIPMLADCYQQELLDRGVNVSGTITAHLVVDNDPELGSIVSLDPAHEAELDFHGPATGSATVAPAAAMKSFTDCIGATLESVVLPPMRGDGQLAITYPFTFSNDDGEDGEDDDGDGEREDGDVGGGGSDAGRTAPATRR
jgi:hypothetical protein